MENKTENEERCVRCGARLQTDINQERACCRHCWRDMPKSGQATIKPADRAQPGHHQPHTKLRLRKAKKMENSVHHIKAGDTIKIDSGKEFVIDSGSILRFGDDDTVLFESTGVKHFGPGENLIEEEGFANVAKSLVVMLETYRHRRWVDLSLSEQGELTGIFSDLVRYHEIDHSKLAEHVGRQMLIDVFKKSVESYACLKEGDTE